MTAEVEDMNPLDDETVLYTVTALHETTRVIGTGAAYTVAEAVEKAENNLIEQLEVIGG